MENVSTFAVCTACDKSIDTAEMTAYNGGLDLHCEACAETIRIQWLEACGDHGFNGSLEEYIEGIKA